MGHLAVKNLEKLAHMLKTVRIALCLMAAKAVITGQPSATTCIRVVAAAAQDLDEAEMAEMSITVVIQATMEKLVLEEAEATVTIPAAQAAMALLLSNGEVRR